MEDPMHADARLTRAPQHLRALERANAVRLARAELKRRVAEGELSAAEVVLSSPWEAYSMPVSDLLVSQRRWGTSRAGKVLELLSIPENKRIGTMTERQRRALATMLGEAEGPCRAEHREALEPALAGVA